MQRFAALIERLLFTPGRNGKLRLLTTYFRETPDPDRGWALAALTDGIAFRHAKPAMIRGLIEDRTDPVLFRLSYDYVGDLAETVALLWPQETVPNSVPSLSDVVEGLTAAGKSEAPGLVAGWLDRLDASERLALLKLITGGLRIGVSARLAKTALAALGEKPVEAVEEIWHGLIPPYRPLFDWLSGTGDRPEIDVSATFHPMMLAHPLEASDYDQIAPGRYRAEWKWDGIRVQLARSAKDGVARLFSRTGDDIAAAFPDLLEGLSFDAVLDGELLVMVDGVVQPFNALQQRLNRKRVTAKMLNAHPAWIRLYDLLFLDGVDLRQTSFDHRRAQLEAFVGSYGPERMDVSPLIPFDEFGELSRIRSDARAAGIEGLMLKRSDGPYLAGRVKGHWYKWKRDPLSADLVLLYAQRGHGKRSGYYSDFTFGAWTSDAAGDPLLVPVAKAYFGFTDEELKLLDKFVRSHTVERFGPVRSVEQKLVVEIAFDSLHPSSRHKSGIAMRFPRISRIRWDKPAQEAETVGRLESLIDA